MTHHQLPPLNALKAFEAAGRLSNFNLAGDELNVTSAAISRHVQRLEEWLGLALFVRRPRGVELTEEGAAYLKEASEALGRLAIATSRVLQRRPREVLLVNSTPTFTLRWLIPKFPRFQRLHPNIEVRIHTSNEPVEKMHAPFDIAIRAGQQDGGSCRAFEVHFGNHLPFCNPKILAEHPIRCVRDLAQHTFLHVSTYPDSWPEWLDEAGAADLQPLHSVSFDDAYMAIQAAVDGLGITIAPVVFVAEELAEGRLTAPLDGPELPSWRRWRYHAYVDEGRADNPAIAQFLDWMHAELTDHSGVSWGCRQEAIGWNMG